MKKTKVLVIRFRRIGDSVLCLSVLNSIKKTIQNSEIHYVLDDYMTDLFENQPCVDKVISFSKSEKKSIPQYLKKVWTLSRTEKYDVIIDMRSTFSTLVFSLFSIKARYRIGVCKPYNKIIHNHRVNILNESGYIHQQLSLLNPLSKEYTIVKDPHFALIIPQKVVEGMKRSMQSKGIDFSKPVLICTVASRVSSKQWNIRYMEDVLKRILNKYKDTQIILNYGNGEEKNTAITICEHIENNNRIFIDIEAKGLMQLGGMLLNANYLFGNEGGVRHISQALDIPSFAIFSPGISIHNWLPDRSVRFDGIACDELKNYESIKTMSPEDQFESITPSEVWNALEQKLDTYLRPAIKHC